MGGKGKLADLLIRSHCEITSFCTADVRGPDGASERIGVYGKDGRSQHERASSYVQVTDGATTGVPAPYPTWSKPNDTSASCAKHSNMDLS